MTIAVNDWMIWSFVLYSVCLVSFSICVGQWLLVQQDNLKNKRRAEMPGATWLMLGLISLAFAVVTALIGFYPAEALKERADEIRSSTTTETVP